MRAWDWQKVIQYTGRCLFRNVLVGESYNVVQELFQCVSQLIQYRTRRADVKSLRLRIYRTMHRFQIHVPKHLHTISYHLLLHVCDDILIWGPTKSTWMYVFERYVGYLVKTIRNRRSPEASLINYHMLATHALYINPNRYDDMVQRMQAETPDIMLKFQSQHTHPRAPRSAAGAQEPDIRRASDVSWPYHKQSTIITLSDDEMDAIRQALVDGPDMEYAAVLKKFYTWQDRQPDYAAGTRYSYDSWLDRYPSLTDRQRLIGGGFKRQACESRQSVPDASRSQCMTYPHMFMTLQVIWRDHMLHRYCL
jgi:hypothetical protein